MPLVEYSVKDRIGYVALNRPAKRNALSYELISEVKHAFTTAENDALVKVIVLRAVGDTFCAGADLAYLQQLQVNSFEENLADSDHLKELFILIYTLKKVVIAEIQGHALAGGCGLATVCDFAFAVPEAKFGYTEVRIGFVPAIVMFFVLKKIGEGRAKYLLLSGETIQAQQAVTWGMINEVVDATNLSNRVENFASQLILNNSPQSMERTKRMIAEMHALPLTNALHYASIQNAQARSSDDCKMGINAFLNKTKLSW
jgi:methylglutaconyl-CoA hydratase